MSSIVEKLMPMVVGIVLMAAAAGEIDRLQMWIWKAQAKVIQDSRTSNWGSPRFFPDRQFSSQK